jgi:hypothetical protein
MGSTGIDASKHAQQGKSDRGEHKAENIRYGEAVSEHGLGGETTDSSGDAQQQGSSSNEDQKRRPRRKRSKGTGRVNDIWHSAHLQVHRIR